MTTENLGEPPTSGGPERHRRVAIVPLAIILGGVLAAIVFAVVVAGLASTSQPESAPTGSASPSIPAPPAVQPAPATDARPAAGPNECVDDRGDGEPVDLDSVALSVDDRRLRVVFVVTDELPDGAASLAVVAENSDGVVFELTSTWEDGELDEFFTRSSGAEREGDEDDDDNKGNGKDNDHGEPERDEHRAKDISNEGTVIIATFPRSVLERLGDGFQWHAVATADGTVVDSCPGAVETGESLEFQP